MKILVCKLRHHGDVLLTTPFFTSLKAAYPHAYIEAYIYAETAPMLEGNPHIDTISVVNRKKELATLWGFAKKKFDLAFNLTEGDRGAITCFASRAKTRVGFAPGPGGMWKKEKLLTHLIEHCPHPKHAVEKNLDALRMLGMSPRQEDRELFFHIPDDARERMQNLAGEGFTLIHPVSRWMHKALPPKTVSEVLRRVPGPIVLTSGPNRAEMNYIDQLDIPEHVINLAGQTTLKELGALIELSDVLFCPDSVPFHMASALKARVVSFFGPSSEKNWGPWRNPNATVLTKDLPCRPCYRPGCGGSKISDCIVSITPDEICSSLQGEVFAEVGLPCD